MARYLLSFQRQRFEDGWQEDGTARECFAGSIRLKLSEMVVSQNKGTPM